MNHPDPTAALSDPRRRRMLVLAGIVVALGVGYGLYWLLHARYYESTDDAYVASDMVQISSEIPGSIAAVYVDDTQHVKQGQVLVELDRADADITMAKAEANLARTVREVRGLFTQRLGLQAQLRERQLALQAAKADLARRAPVAEDGAVSAEEMQHASDQVAQRKAALDATREALRTTNAQTEGTTIETHPLVLAAAAQVRDAELALRRTRIGAPVDGTIARRSAQIGARVAPGAPLMAVVPLANVWVDANFKEVQLANVRIGQPVTLRADFYGSSIEYHGRVAGLGAGSGSAFALLPPQNASGNWIKIVQRVPVRIALEPKELESHPLRVGLSMRARIDMHDTSGALMATEVRAQPQTVATDATADSAATERIARIIAGNAGAANRVVR